MAIKSATPQVNFGHFLEKFPEIELPVTLSDDLHHTFGKVNNPLSPLMVQQHITPFEKEVINDLTEYIACFRIPETYEFFAIVYWKAALMDYQYILATYDKKGNFIDSRSIGGTFSDGKTVIKSVATFEPDWVIYIMTGQIGGTGGTYDAETSKTIELGMMPDGRIVDSV